MAQNISTDVSQFFFLLGMKKQKIPLNNNYDHMIFSTLYILYQLLPLNITNVAKIKYT